MPDFETIAAKIVAFRDARDWEQFHNQKDLALAISVEAAELNELFLWKKHDDVNVESVKEELADVLIYCFLLAHQNGLDVSQIISDKLQMNEAKYPVDKAKGNARKYNQF